MSYSFCIVYLQNQIAFDIEISGLPGCYLFIYLSIYLFICLFVYFNIFPET